jgi:hypothetical protein
MMAKHDLMKAGAEGLAETGCTANQCHPAFLAMVLLAVSLLTACAPKPAAVALIPDDYSSWRRTTDLRLDYPIPGHEDNFRIIYMNDTGFGFSRTAEGQSERVVFPEGTVIAKEVYAGSAPEPGAKPMMVTAMIKDSDNADGKGGWVWVTKDLAMGKETVITGDFCFTCHTNANEAHPYGDKNQDEGFCDYVFFVPEGTSEVQ